MAGIAWDFAGNAVVRGFVRGPAVSTVRWRLDTWFWSGGAFAHMILERCAVLERSSRPLQRTIKSQEIVMEPVLLGGGAGTTGRENSELTTKFGRASAVAPAEWAFPARRWGLLGSSELCSFPQAAVLTDSAQSDLRSARSPAACLLRSGGQARRDHDLPRTGSSWRISRTFQDHNFTDGLRGPA